MIELNRNFQHGSEIATYFRTDSSGKIISVIKVANTPEGLKNITNEKKGLEWFGSRISLFEGIITDYVYSPQSIYAKIEMRHIEGRKVDYNKGLLRNKDAIITIINRYMDMWPEKENGFSVLHGDLSLDNIIFHKNDIFILDWEHFSNDGAPWGFDILYLLFESLWFETRDRQPQTNSLKVLADMLSIVSANPKLHSSFRKVPLHGVIDFIKNHFSLWGEQLKNVPRKLPILLFNESQISLIDEYIQKTVLSKSC